MKSLDSYRKKNKSKIKITKEQREFLIECREHPMPVHWADMAELWKELGWGDYSSTALRQRYNKIKAEQKK